MPLLLGVHRLHRLRPLHALHGLPRVPPLHRDRAEHRLRVSGSLGGVQRVHILLRVRRALEDLPPAQRVAFELVREEGMSLADAARTLGTTVGGAKQRMHRAYEAIRAALADAEPALRRGIR